MTARFWILATANALFVLLLSLCWFFFLLLALNGVSEARAQPVLLSGIVVAVAMIVLSFGAGGWGTRSLIAATDWSFWLVGPALVVVTLVVTSLAFFVCTIILLIVHKIG